MSAFLIFIRTKWKEAQASFDQLIDKKLGKIGTKLNGL